jgi:CBS domain-containing protein
MGSWRVGDVMTTEVVSVGRDVPYREIVDILADRRISAVPVVDPDNRVVGVVSEPDLLHKVELAGLARRRLLVRRRRRTALAKAHAAVAHQLMTTPPVTIGADASVTEAAKVMFGANVKRLPVVNRDGTLVGIVARGDLLLVFLRSDTEIEQEVADRILDRIMLLEQGTVGVRVHDGVVTLTGRTDLRSTAQVAVGLARAVPGVVGVVDRIRCEVDEHGAVAVDHPGLRPFQLP